MNFNNSSLLACSAGLSNVQRSIETEIIIIDSGTFSARNLLFYTECGMGKHYGGIFADVFSNYPLPCRALW